MRTKNEKGQVLVLFVLGIIGLLAITGLAIDGGNVFADRRQAQNAADNAAFAAALERAKLCGKLADPTQCGPFSIPDVLWQSKGFGVALANGYDNNAPKPFNDNDIGNAVYIFYPPVEGQYAGQLNYVQVIIDSHISTYFTKIIGWNVLRNHVSAVVKVNDVVVEPLYAGNAMIALAPSGDKMYWVQGNSNLTVKGSGVFVNSSDPCAFQVGSGNNNSSTTIAVPSITTVGGTCPAMSGSVSTGAKQYSYPPDEFPLPEIQCTFDGTLNADKKRVTAGHWSHFPPAGADKDLTLGPGIYCIDNGLSLSGGESWQTYHWDESLYNDSGQWGVLLYFTNVCSGNGCDIKFAGNSKINLHSYTLGPYPNLLIYVQPVTPCYPDNVPCREVTLTGSNGSSIFGTVFAPDSNLTIIGNNGSFGLNSQLISYSMDLSGSSGTTISYNDSQQWDAPTSPSIELMK